MKPQSSSNVRFMPLIPWDLFKLSKTHLFHAFIARGTSVQRVKNVFSKISLIVLILLIGQITAAFSVMC